MGVDLHGRMNPQSPLKAGEIVIGNVLPDHSAQLLPAGKPSAIIALPLKDAPEALHWAIVNALTYSGHALGHPGCGQLVMKYPGRILKAPIAVEQGMCVRICGNGPIQRLMDQGAVIGVPEGKGDDPPVAQVQDRAEVEFVDG